MYIILLLSSDNLVPRDMIRAMRISLMDKYDLYLSDWDGFDLLLTLVDEPHITGVASNTNTNNNNNSSKVDLNVRQSFYIYSLFLDAKALYALLSIRGNFIVYVIIII